MHNRFITPNIVCRTIAREHGNAILKSVDDPRFDPETAARQMEQTARLIRAEIIDARALEMANNVNAAGD